MTEIRWSNPARRDYRNIIEWLEENYPPATQRTADAIARRLVRLETMPEIGRPGRLAGTRELVIIGTPYVIVCRIEDDGAIGIARVLHGAQRWPPT